VRPTTDRTREALFSIIAVRLPGCSFLDLFAGSGAIGLEAWSRGARSVCWVEANRRAAAGVRANAEALGVADPKVWVGDAVSVLKKELDGGPFDVIFADPPYEWGQAEAPGHPRRKGAHRGGSVAMLAEMIRAAGHLAQGGVFILEQSADAAEQELPGWRLIDRRKYGKTKLLFFSEEDPLP
jgi:16S rRNA (guanine966-N2)-methyltransferase